MSRIIPQIKERDIYQYPRRWTRVIGGLCVVLLLLNLSEYVLEWIRAVYASLYYPLQLPLVPLMDPYQKILPTLLVSHIGLLATLAAVRAVAFLTPRITLRDDGLFMQTGEHRLLGQRLIRYADLRDVRSVELAPGGRYLVWVHAARGLPWQGWLASLLFGRWLWRGFLLTSDLDGFDQTVARIVAELKTRHGEQGFPAHFSEESPAWLLAMLTSPRDRIHELATSDVIPITQQEAGVAMASVALSLAIPAALGALVHLQVPLGSPILFLLAMLEWPLVSLYLTAVPIGESQRMQFEEAIRIYPMTQLPRWVPAIVLTLLIIAGAPTFLLLLAVFAAIAFAARPVYTLTKEWFAVQFPDALMGILVTVIYQLVLYEGMVIVLAR